MVRYLTNDGFWMEPNGGKLYVGITADGALSIGGVSFVEVDEKANKIIVEGSKDVFEITLPVTDGDLHDLHVVLNTNKDNYDETPALAYYDGGWHIDHSRVEEINKEDANEI